MSRLLLVKKGVEYPVMTVRQLTEEIRADVRELMLQGFYRVEAKRLTYSCDDAMEVHPVVDGDRLRDDLASGFERFEKTHERVRLAVDLAQITVVNQDLVDVLGNSWDLIEAQRGEGYLLGVSEPIKKYFSRIKMIKGADNSGWSVA